MSTSQTAKGVLAERLLRSVTCPHCWQSFEVGDLVWVAEHDELRGDPVLGSDAHVRFRPTRFDVAGDALDARGTPCQVVACPTCHLEIPRVLLRYPSMIFSLIGMTFSGKSYYLTSMAWEMARLLKTQFLLTFLDVDPEGSATLTEYRTTLFLPEDPDRPTGLLKTQPDSTSHYESANLNGQAVLLPRPFLFSLSPAPGHPNAAASEDHSRILCLYDNAGEQFQPGEDKTLTPGTRHMAQSAVLMFLYDPTQDSRIRERCRAFSNDPQLSTCAHTQLQGQALTEAAGRVRRYAHLPSTQKLTQPLLVLVSKSDAWHDLIDDDIVTEPYLAPDPPNRPLAAVDLPRIHATSAAVRALLLELAPEFVAAAEDCCKTVVYIPVSALGCSPRVREADDFLVVKPRDISPRWVTVPMIYAFSVWASGLTVVRRE